MWAPTRQWSRNVFGTATSQGAVLVVDSKPIICAAGGAGHFSRRQRPVSVSDEGPALAYQWWHGHNSCCLELPRRPWLSQTRMAGAQGDYLAVVTNFAGSTTSAPATLTFDSSALSILVPPKDQTVEAVIRSPLVFWCRAFLRCLSMAA